LKRKAKRPGLAGAAEIIAVEMALRVSIEQPDRMGSVGKRSERGDAFGRGQKRHLGEFHGTLLGTSRRA